MSDGPEWFAPKRYGYGAGLPITWQGWALTVVFLAVSIGLAFTSLSGRSSSSPRSRRSSCCLS